MKHPKHYDTDQATSKRMAAIKLKHGVAETILAKALWNKGYRYRLNYRKLPGSPDIAITKYCIAIFVDGEFWHGKDWNTKKQQIKRNREYWIAKIEENIARDEKVDMELIKQGWVPVRFWSNQIKNDAAQCVEEIIELIEEIESRNLDAE